jgi:hypothetical protein
MAPPDTWRRITTRRDEEPGLSGHLARQLDGTLVDVDHGRMAPLLLGNVCDRAATAEEIEHVIAGCGLREDAPSRERGRHGRRGERRSAQWSAKTP